MLSSHSHPTYDENLDPQTRSASCLSVFGITILRFFLHHTAAADDLCSIFARPGDEELDQFVVARFVEPAERSQYCSEVEQITVCVSFSLTLSGIMYLRVVVKPEMAGLEQAVFLLSAGMSVEIDAVVLMMREFRSTAGSSVLSFH